PRARAATSSRCSRRSRPRPRPRSRPNAPTIQCAFICAKWARWSCFRARAKVMPAPAIGSDGQPIAAAGTQGAGGGPSVLAQTPALPAVTTPPERNNGDDGDSSEVAPGEADFDDDDMENSLSLAAIEAELKPKVVETFDNIASEYK